MLIPLVSTQDGPLSVIWQGLQLIKVGSPALTACYTLSHILDTVTFTGSFDNVDWIGIVFASSNIGQIIRESITSLLPWMVLLDMRLDRQAGDVSHSMWTVMLLWLRHFTAPHYSTERYNLAGRLSVIRRQHELMLKPLKCSRFGEV